MLFYELLSQLTPNVQNSIEEVFSTAFQNQTHEQDLLLVDQHGFYNEVFDQPKVKERHKLSPYVIGPDFIGFSENTQYEFINWYRTSHLVGKKEFEKAIKADTDVIKEEQMSIHIEKSIYLKFWESDLILKKLFQLSLLSSGLPYDWHITIPTKPREGSKHEIVRTNIRDKVKTIAPNFYNLINDNYKYQISSVRLTENRKNFMLFLLNLSRPKSELAFQINKIFYYR